MARETKCLTPDANFSSYIRDSTIGAFVHLPFKRDLDEKEAELLESLIHNQLELVLRSYFNGR